MKTQRQAGERGAAEDAPWHPVKVVAAPSSSDVHGEPMIEVTFEACAARAQAA
jgi:hypothetical protein